MPIIQSISKFLHGLQIPITTLSNINRQKRFLRKNIIPKLTDAKRNADSSLDDADIKKITGYYGLAVPAVLGEAFCVLRGKAMTQKERLASTCQGAMTGLGDDFFDRQRLSPQGVKDFIETPGKFTGNTASERLFLDFYKTALTNAPEAAKMQAQIFNVFKAQMLSKQQDAPGLSSEVIQDITVRKGGESLLYYRTAFTHELKPGEEKMLYALGGLMQLSNDIFDVYKDQQDGVSTLVTTAEKIEELLYYFSAQLKIGIEAAYRSGYAKAEVRKFLGLLNICIFSRCYVCLDQLQKKEKKSNGIFNPKKYSRKDLICDMDTVGNKLKSLNYHMKMYRKLR
jgi:hypothetical protein